MRKIFINIPSHETSYFVQKVGFSYGFVWHEGEQIVSFEDWPYLGIQGEKHPKEFVAFTGLPYKNYPYDEYKEVNLPEFLLELSKSL